MFKLIISKLLTIPAISRLSQYLWQIYVTTNLSQIKERNLKELYSQIKKNQLDIQSDTSTRDCKALEKVTQMVLKEGVVIAEIGSWKGMTTSVLAKTVKDFNGKVFAIDHWKGCEGAPHHEELVKGQDIFSIFKQNIETLGLQSFVLPLVTDSITASSLFADRSLSMVFIDADHRFNHVKQDIKAWLPKVRAGGIIAGHDCEIKYTETGEYHKVIDENRNTLVTPGVCHPGVTKALYDMFQDKYNIVPNSSIWWYRRV